jgi:hypothetical protein
VRRLVEAGYAEVVLTGVDITDYGAGLPGEMSLGRLVRHILRQVPELRRLRLSSIDQVEAMRISSPPSPRSRGSCRTCTCRAGRRRHYPQAHEATPLTGLTRRAFVQRSAGYGPTSSSAPT